MGEYLTKAHLLKLIEKGWEGLDYSYNGYYRYKGQHHELIACCAIGAAGIAYDRERGYSPMAQSAFRDPGSIRNVVPKEIQSMIFRINDASWYTNRDGFVMMSLAAKKRYIIEQIEEHIPEW